MFVFCVLISDSEHCASAMAYMSNQPDACLLLTSISSCQQPASSPLTARRNHCTLRASRRNGRCCVGTEASSNMKPRASRLAHSRSLVSLLAPALVHKFHLTDKLLSSVATSSLSRVSRLERLSLAQQLDSLLWVRLPLVMRMHCPLGLDCFVNFLFSSLSGPIYWF